MVSREGIENLGTGACVVTSGCCSEEMVSKCPKTSGWKYPQNKTLPFDKIPTSFSISEWALYPLSLKLAKSLWRPLKQSQRGEVTAPSAVPHHSALSLPLGCSLHANLITRLAAQLRGVVVPAQGSWSPLRHPARCSREWWPLSWGREPWTPRDLSP